MASSSTVPEVVTVDYAQLIDQSIDLDSLIDRSFGANSLGLICVKNVPQYSEARRRLLPLSYQFASMDQSAKQLMEDPESMYSFGWSHGKEQMKSGKPDVAKGSFYNNPVHDDPFNISSRLTANQPSDQSNNHSSNHSDSQLDSHSTSPDDVLARWPTSARPNIWPSFLPEFEPAFKSLGSIIVETGACLATHIDKFVHRRLASYPPNHLNNIILRSKTHKARLLHYFPIDQPTAQTDEVVEEDSWCGFHNDHSSLTGLTVAMYINNQTSNKQSVDYSDSPPDNQSGLLVQLRNQSIVALTHIDPDMLIFQLGETQMIHSGGIVQATPHAVRAPKQSSSQPSTSREAFAVFMGPPLDHSMKLPAGVTEDELLKASAIVNMPASVPHLRTRWNPQMDFATFGERTIAAYLVK